MCIYTYAYIYVCVFIHVQGELNVFFRKNISKFFFNCQLFIVYSVIKKKWHGWSERGRLFSTEGSFTGCDRLSKQGMWIYVGWSVIYSKKTV